jgi:hypothetical protein
MVYTPIMSMRLVANVIKLGVTNVLIFNSLLIIERSCPYSEGNPLQVQVGGYLLALRRAFVDPIDDLLQLVGGELAEVRAISEHILDYQA